MNAEMEISKNQWRSTGGKPHMRFLRYFVSELIVLKTKLLRRFLLSFEGLEIPFSFGPFESFLSGFHTYHVCEAYCSNQIAHVNQFKLVQ